MAWRKKALALFCCLVLVCVLFLQEYINISVKLPTYDYGDTHSHEMSSIGASKARGISKHGSYTVIKSARRRNERFKTTREYSADYHDIGISNKNRRRFPELLPKEKSRLASSRDNDYSELTLDSDVTTEHAHRIKKFKMACLDTSAYRKQEQRKGNLSDFYYSRAHKFAYCKVPKSGSTFWMKVFMILAKGDNYSRLISHMPRSEIHARTQLFVTDPGRILHNNIRTIVISRNPFSRLFSAYVDKVYVPLFWDQFRTMENVTVLQSFYRSVTVEVFKSSKLPLSSRLAKYRQKFRERGLLVKKEIKEKVTPICANNATFEAFLKFIISEIKYGRPLEPHWAPISHLCHPCKFNTYKIVKQESFSADVDHTLKSVGVNISKFDWLKSSLNEMRAENSVPGIIAVIKQKFKQRKVDSCITQSEISRRLWKSFQIQGFISKEIEFPETLLHDDWNSKSRNVTEVVLDTISQKRMTLAERDKQREYFLKQAYSDIPADIISSLQDIYYLDFLLFNYSMNAP